MFSGLFERTSAEGGLFTEEEHARGKADRERARREMEDREWEATPPEERVGPKGSKAYSGAQLQSMADDEKQRLCDDMNAQLAFEAEGDEGLQRELEKQARERAEREQMAWDDVAKAEAKKRNFVPLE
eukprot:6813091-Prymnesium_polylepis.1